MQIQAHGGDIYSARYRLDFSTNVNPLGPPESVRQAVISSARFLEQYPDVQCRELRHALSESMGIQEDFIICSNGSAELIYSIAAAVKPRSALVVCPAFSEYEQALHMTGCTNIEYYFCTRANGFQLMPDILDQITDELDILYLANPANPTGVLFSHSLLQEIARRCCEMRVVLVLDESYNGLLEHPEKETLRGLLEENPGLFIIDAFTKTYAMPGIRLGYGMSSNLPLMGKIQTVVQPWNVSVAAQMAGIAALSEKSYVEDVRKMIAAELVFMKQMLQRVGLRYVDSAANFILIEAPPALYDQCRERGILIRDCSSFRGLRPGYFRLAVRARRENEEILGLLSSLCRNKARTLPSYLD